MSGLEVCGTGTAVYVMRDGIDIAGPFRGRKMAELHIDVLERKSRLLERACLSCRNPFLSEGTHNRMCEKCRAAAQGFHLGRV